MSKIIILSPPQSIFNYLHSIPRTNYSHGWLQSYIVNSDKVTNFLNHYHLHNIHNTFHSSYHTRIPTYERGSKTIDAILLYQESLQLMEVFLHLNPFRQIIVFSGLILRYSLSLDPRNWQSFQPPVADWNVKTHVQYRSSVNPIGIYFKNRISWMQHAI